MLEVITDPVESQVDATSYNRRNQKAADEKLANMVEATPEEIRAIREKLKEQR